MKYERKLRKQRKFGGKNLVNSQNYRNKDDMVKYITKYKSYKEQELSVVL